VFFQVHMAKPSSYLHQSRSSTIVGVSCISYDRSNQLKIVYRSYHPRIFLALGGGPNHDELASGTGSILGPSSISMGLLGPKGHFLGWWAVMTQAAFSFIGTEIVAVRIRLSYFFSSVLNIPLPDCRWRTRTLDATS